MISRLLFSILITQITVTFLTVHGSTHRCPTDVVFLLDSSESQYPSDFNESKHLVERIVGLLPIPDYRYGAIAFSRTITEIPLRDFTNSSQFIEDVHDFPHKRGRTLTHSALEALIDMMVTQNDGRRRRVGVVMTDGASHVAANTRAMAQEVHEKDITMFALSIGFHHTYPAHQQELSVIVGGNASRIVHNQDFVEMYQLIRDTSYGVCHSGPDDPPGDSTECLGDVVFLLDSSESLYSSDFNVSKHFVEKLVVSLPPSYRYGAIAYSHNVTKIPLRNFDDLPQFITDVHNFPHKRRRTETHNALQSLIDMMRIQSRSAAAKIGVLISDGFSHISNSTLAKAREVLDQNIIMFAVGVGHRIHLNELEVIVGGNTSRIILGQNHTQLINLIGDACRTVTSPPTTSGPPRDPSGPDDEGDPTCNNCSVKNGVGYLAHRDNCGLYYQCESNSSKPELRSCPVGLYWSQPLLTCVRPFKVTCRDDPCKDANIREYAYTNSCRRFWMCFNNQTHSMSCCRPGTRFVSGLGCISSAVACNDACRAEAMATNDTCLSEPHENDNTKFYVVDPYTSNRTEMSCARGSAYNTTTCLCSIRINVSQSLSCDPEIQLPFDTDLKDHSGNNVPNGAPWDLKTCSVAGSRGGGAVCLRGNDYIAVWRFSNDDFKKSLVIRFRFMEEPTSATIDHNETLVTNTDCNTKDYSVAVYYNREASQVYGHLYTSRRHELSLDKSTGWNDVQLRYDGNVFAFTVNGRTRTAFAEGDINRKHGSLQIGGRAYCPNPQGFLGYIDDFYLYKCI